MPFGFVGRVSSANTLKEALDQSVERSRGIASRVARAGVAGADGFALPSLDPANPAGTPGAEAAVDLEREMVALADEQIRFEATAKLLQGTYQKIRLSIKGS